MATIIGNYQQISQPALVLMMVVAIWASLWQPVSTHGRLWTPPGRVTAWRKHFPTPTYYDDNQMFCGGFQHQESLGYKCGLCGDPYDSDRPSEAGGLFATGTITGNYTQGQEIVIQVDLTANHKGWFEFKICPTNDYTVKATQECLDSYTLQLADGSGSKLDVTGVGSVMLSIPVVLPWNLYCSFCVLQWHYHAGNSWGTDPDGTRCVGCGNQEEFYGCADIKIEPAGDQATNAPITTTTTTTTSTQLQTTSTTEPQTTTTTVAPTTSTANPTTTNTTTPDHSGIPLIYSCIATQLIPGLVEWCNNNCNMNYCPETHCDCLLVPDPRASQSDHLPAGCYATAPFSHWPGMDSWCDDNCPHGSNVCQHSRCFCKV